MLANPFFIFVITKLINIIPRDLGKYLLDTIGTCNINRIFFFIMKMLVNIVSVIYVDTII